MHTMQGEILVNELTHGEWENKCGSIKILIVYTQFLNIKSSFSFFLEELNLLKYFSSKL